MDNFEVQFGDVPDLSLGMPDGGQGDSLADLDGLFEELSALEQVSSRNILTILNYIQNLVVQCPCVLTPDIRGRLNIVYQFNCA